MIPDFAHGGFEQFFFLEKNENLTIVNIAGIV